MECIYCHGIVNEGSNFCPHCGANIGNAPKQEETNIVSTNNFGKMVFDADVYILRADEDGRRVPFINNYRPQFYFGDHDLAGIVTLNGVEMANPGDNVNMTVELVDAESISIGQTFTICEGGRTVGRGTITKIY